MLTKRIIPCLDVRDNVVVKGINFSNHQVVGDILALAKRYIQEGADELVFYEITASCTDKPVDRYWISLLAEQLTIPFCVAGGIRDIGTAESILAAGCDKISVNSPALENPAFITELAERFGSQCVVVGIDSRFEYDDNYVYQYTGVTDKSRSTQIPTLEWAKQAADRGAGEIVINSMGQDGMRNGYDINLLLKIKNIVSIPVIASGGAGSMQHFRDVFQQTNVDGALAASVFHRQEIRIPELKAYLQRQKIEVRP